MEIAEQAERAIRKSHQLIEQCRQVQNQRALALAAIRENRAATEAKIAAAREQAS